MLLYCQFDLFEATNIYDKHEFSEYTLEHRTHPHSYIRLLYGCDAMKEAAMDVIEMLNQIDSATSERVVSELLKTSIDDLLCFLEKMGLKNIRFDIFRPELIECHYSIRKKRLYGNTMSNHILIFICKKCQKNILILFASLKICKY